MRHRMKGRKLGRRIGHRKELIRNLITSLILYEKIITSEAKAKVVKSEIEKILTIGRKNDLHSRRLLLSRLNSKSAVRKIFEDLNNQFKNKKSGYVRIIKIDNRKGDNSKCVLLELLIKHKEDNRKVGKAETTKARDKIEDTKEDKNRPGFWERLRGKENKPKIERIATKKTVERTTSK